MVQKHDATRLHWDFRLELDGVLKSWAVTRGPSLDPDDKRLAVRTEDHPLDYATFEGTIPEGEYGGGTVMLWDRGTWKPVAGQGSAQDARAEGHLHFILDGERMKGEWLLHPDEAAAEETERELAAAQDRGRLCRGSAHGWSTPALTSVDRPGGRCSEIAEGKKSKSAILPAAKKAAAPARALRSRQRPLHRPSRVPLRSRETAALPRVQLATLVDHVPTGAGWLHEVKYDGYRALLAFGGGEAKIYTRAGLDWSDKLPGDRRGGRAAIDARSG